MLSANLPQENVSKSMKNELMNLTKLLKLHFILHAAWEASENPRKGKAITVSAKRSADHPLHSKLRKDKERKAHLKGTSLR